MTWGQLKDRLADPIVAGGLLLLVIGELQAQSGVLLDWLSPEAAGRVLSLIGILGTVVRYVQTLPAPREFDDDDSQNSGV